MNAATPTDALSALEVIERPAPNDLDSFWMPFTMNRMFKKAPRLLAGADGVSYTSHDGRRIIDGTAGLWCVNAGHGRAKIREAIQRQCEIMDYAPSFQVSHPLAFELSNRLISLLPESYGQVFYTNSGSESVDTALKIALAYHRARGQAERRVLIGRERGYHGVGFGGISVGGIPGNRKAFGQLLPQIDHLRHTHNPDKQRHSIGQPDWGAELAEDLERIATLHDPSNVAAVIVEPVAGSTGVLPPPVGYLERLREICDQHGILLIFDEVITGYGRMGTPFAVQRFGVEADIICTAKGLTNGTVPMGAVYTKRGLFDALCDGPEYMMEMFHGYTYSAHPLACAAALATVEIYREEGLFNRAAAITPQWYEAVNAMKDLPHVIDTRCMGLTAGIELAPRPGAPTRRGYDAMVKAFEAGLLIRHTGETLALSPPLIIEEQDISQIFAILAGVLKALD